MEAAAVKMLDYPKDISHGSLRLSDMQLTKAQRKWRRESVHASMRSERDAMLG